ncbi:MAG: flavoprotein [Synergistaceae bacterium]|jgi:flavoprotein|nr:flavoprotein [Synergistaceae bacterium]
MSEYSRICWVITGAGHFLAETVDFLCGDLSFSVDLCFTRAGYEVSARYGQAERIMARGFDKVCRETGYSSPGLIYFSGGRYDALVIAPATSNTVSKCALGIADSLASNYFAQAGKSGTPIFVLPTDNERDITSVTPSGREIRVHARDIDLERRECLSKFPGVTVLGSPEEFGVFL